METNKRFFKRNNGSEAIIIVIGTHESGDYLCLWLSDSGRQPFRYHKYDFDKEFVEISEEEINKLERHRCGRRDESPLGQSDEEKPDYWKVLQNGDKVCSYCGSLHPQTLIELVKKYGVEIIEGTTKGYKWYVNQPGVSNATQGGIKYYRHHDTEDFIKQLNELIKQK